MLTCDKFSQGDTLIAWCADHKVPQVVQVVLYIYIFTLRMVQWLVAIIYDHLSADFD